MIFVVSNPGPFSVSVFFSGKNLPTKIRLREHSIMQARMTSNDYSKKDQIVEKSHFSRFPKKRPIVETT